MSVSTAASWKSVADLIKINLKFAYVPPKRHTMNFEGLIFTTPELTNFRVQTDFFDQKDEHVECTVR